MSLNLGVILHEGARRWPNQTALVAGGERLTYRYVDEQARRFAGALAELGVRPGQPIALMLPNVPAFTVAYFGAHYCAAPVVPLNVLLKTSEIAYHLANSDAVALVVWEGFLDEAQPAFAEVDACRHLIVAGSESRLCQGAHDMDVLVATARPSQELPATQPDDTAVILYTSGTTGKPKGAELTHFNMFFNAEYVATHLLSLRPDNVSLAVLPLFHSFGQTVVHNATLRAGGTVALCPRFEPELAFNVMQSNRVSLFAGVPTMYFALLHHPNADRYDLTGLRYCVSGGASMPIEVMKAFDEKYGVNILEGYGLSETSPLASFNQLDRPKKAGSIGMPIWGVDFRLEDAQGNVIATPGTPGEICIKGHNVMRGYYKNDEATEEVIHDGWFHSGDVATFDDDGFYFIVDRKKDMIIRGGYNVYPREIEEVLYGHPSVAEVAVIGVPDARYGEEVKAVVSLKPGAKATSDELIGWCKERLASYKYPRIVEVVAGLPKGPTGKILKRELRLAEPSAAVEPTGTHCVLTGAE